MVVDHWTFTALGFLRPVSLTTNYWPQAPYRGEWHPRTREVEHPGIEYRQPKKVFRDART